MASFFLNENRMEQDRRKDKYAFDLYLPFNAGRQVVKRNEKFPGGYNAERPSNLINVRDWINAQMESGYIQGYGRYVINNNLHVVASRAGITSTSTPGNLTLVMPKYCDLFKLNCTGTAANLVNDELIIDLIYDSTFYQFNDDTNSMTMPNIQIWDYSLPAANSDVISSTYYAVNITAQEPPTKTIIASGNNRLTIKIQGLENYSK